MKEKVIDYLMIFLGVSIVAFASHVFMIPNNFVAGGITGLAIVINKLFPVMGIGIYMVILNIILFSLGFLLIGAHFGSKTIFSSFLLSGLIWLFDVLFPISKPLTNDRFVELLVSMVIIAIGMSLVFRHNASTGGTDITAKILNKYFHIELGKGVLISDVFITLLALIVFDLETVLYGLVGIFLNGFIIDFILNKFREAKEIRVITKNIEPLVQFIIHDMEKGATIYKAYGAYTNEAKDVVTTILNRQEYIRLKQFIKQNEIDAFITIANINETYGLGFESLMDE